MENGMHQGDQGIHRTRHDSNQLESVLFRILLYFTKSINEKKNTNNVRKLKINLRSYFIITVSIHYNFAYTLILIID